MYVEYLSDLPAKYLAQAINEWIRGNIFFPAIAELREITNRKAEVARRQREELEYLERKRDDDERYAQMQRPTPEQMEEIKARIAGRYPSTRR